MQRVGNSRNPAKDKFGTGKNGFQGGDLGAGQAATTPGFEWFDSMQEEVAGVIESAGITLDATKFNQLYLAIKRIFIKSTTLTDTGTANAYTAANSPALVLNDIKPGLTQQVLITNANTGASTYSPDGLRQDPIYGLGLQPLQGGELIAGATAILMSATISGVNGGNPIWVLLECMGGAQQVPNGTKSQHAVALGQLTNYGTMAAGTTFFFAGATAPAGSLVANGAAISRSIYAALFAAIGTTFGAGDGSTTFNLPDLRGEFIRGFDNGRGLDAGRTFGSTQTDALQNITGSAAVYAPTSTASASGAFSASGAGSALTGGSSAYSLTLNLNASSVARTSTETRPHNVALLPCIKY